MRFSISLIVALSFAVQLSVGAEQSRTIEKTIPVGAGKTIVLEEFSGAGISFRAWDKPEVAIRVKAIVRSSDEEAAGQILDTIGFEESSDASAVRIRLKPVPEQKSITVRILGIEFGSHLETQISGEIFLPRNNPVRAEMRYGRYSFEGQQGELSVEGKGNTLVFRNCTRLATIENGIGSLDIQNCSGTMNLTAGHSKLVVDGFTGPLDAKLDYSSVALKNLSGAGTKRMRLSSKSATISLENIRQGMDMRAPYSKIAMNDIEGDLFLDASHSVVSLHRLKGAFRGTMSYSSVSLADLRSGDISVEMQHGPLSINLLELPRNVEIKNEHGPVKLVIPEGYKGAVSLETGYAGIHSELPLTRKELGRNRVSAQMSGTGPGKITITNNFGPIRLVAGNKVSGDK